MTDDALIATIALDEWLNCKARIRELGAALRDLLALADISQPLPDLVPGVILRARATLDRSGEHG